MYQNLYKCIWNLFLPLLIFFQSLLLMSAAGTCCKLRIFNTVETVVAIVQQVALLHLQRAVPAKPLDDILVDDVQACRQDGSPEEEVYGTGPEVWLTGSESAESDGRQGDEAEVEGLVEGPPLGLCNKRCPAGNITDKNQDAGNDGASYWGSSAILTKENNFYL